MIFGTIGTFFGDFLDNPFWLYTFYEKYCWWIWEGTNISEFFGREIGTGAAILKLFIVGPFIGVILLFPFWLDILAFYWCYKFLTNKAAFPCGLTMSEALKYLPARRNEE